MFFGSRYWGPRYFGPHYWGTGAAAGAGGAGGTPGDAASFKLLWLTDKPICQGAVPYGVLLADALLSADDVRAVEEQESLAFSYPRVDDDGDVRAITAQLRPGRVLSDWWSDDSYDEWRVGSVKQGRGLNGIVTVECVPLVLDLTERADSVSGKGWVSELRDGERIFDFEITERTARSIFETYIIPNLPDWVTLGTIDPTVVIPTISVNRMTPWQLAVEVRDTLRSMDVANELDFWRNGFTDYKLGLVTQIGSSAATPVFHPNVSLTSLTRTEDVTLQATRILVLGGTAPDTFPGVMGRARWPGTPTGGLVIALTDRNGGASPIAFDNQWVNAYLLRVKTGRTYRITASNAAAGTVTLLGTVSTIAADEDFEFRLTEPQTNTRLRANPVSGLTTEPHPLEITAIDSGAKTLTLTNNFGAGALDLIEVNNQHVDWVAEIYTQVLDADTSATPDPTNNWWTFTEAVTAVQVGDLVIPGNNAAAAYDYSYVGQFAGRVTAIDTGTKRLTVERFWGSGDALVSGTSARLGVRVYRYLRSERIEASTAATDKITVASVGGVTASQALLVILQTDGAGEVPAYVDHPLYAQADPVGYGIKVGEISRTNNLGITQLIPNSWMQDWSNSANPPEGWTRAGLVTWSRDSVTTRFGGYSQKFVVDATGSTRTLTSPVFYPNWDPGHTRLSVRAWVYFDAYAVVGGVNFTSNLRVFAVTALGGVGAELGLATSQPMNGGLTGTKFEIGGWVELKIEGLTLGPTTAPYGLLMQFEPASFTSNPVDCTGYLDTCEAYPFMLCPSASYKFGDATSLAQAGNRKLAEVASPPVSYQMGAHDLAQAFPNDFPRLATTVGGNIRAADIEYGMDPTVRLLRRDRDLLGKKEPRFYLANRATRLTELMQAGVQKVVTEPTTALVSSVGAAGVLTAPLPLQPPLTVYTVPATISTGYTVTTPADAPVLTAEKGSSVTYAPAVATSPMVTVAPALVGAPPRPRPGRTRVLT